MVDDLDVVASSGAPGGNSDWRVHFFFPLLSPERNTNSFVRPYTLVVIFLTPQGLLLDIPNMSSPKSPLAGTSSESSEPKEQPVATAAESALQAALQAALDRISSLEQRLAPLEQVFATMVVEPFLDDNQAEQMPKSPSSVNDDDNDVIWENIETRPRSSAAAASTAPSEETPDGRPRSTSVLEVKPLILEPSMMSNSAEAAASEAEAPSSPVPYESEAESVTGSQPSTPAAPQDVDSEYEHEEITVHEDADLDPEVADE